VKTTFIEVTSQVSPKVPCRVFFKNEYEQPSGSFKLRGLGYLIEKSLEKARALGKAKVHVFSSSGGNAGLGAAFAAQFHGTPCTVVLPTTSKPIVIQKLESLNAQVVIAGNHWGEADAHLKDVIAQLDSETYPVYCHPFDDQLIWEGHGTLIEEIVESDLSQKELQSLKGVVCCVGGGGLFNGVIDGLTRCAERLSPEIAVLAVETIQAPTFTTAIAEGKVVHLASVPTLATSLASPYISAQSLEHYNAQRFKITVEAIDDVEAIRGMVDYHAEFDRIVEPACGASLSSVYNRVDLLEKAFGKLGKEDIIVVVVCGGSSTTPQSFKDFKKLLE
ncbi:hypothetical protein BABINDRAFT_27780, partial [Babjeviella inositovora NRRL Y-12698]